MRKMSGGREVRQVRRCEAFGDCCDGWHAVLARYDDVGLVSGRLSANGE
jgi:hypothetical protein